MDDMEAHLLRQAQTIGKLRSAIKSASEELLRICDGSNWPEYAQSGDGYIAYGEITEQLHEVADNLLEAGR